MSSVDTQNFGEALKARRNELNMSLKEIENATSIRINYLQAIEEGKTNKLISPVYAQGFIRQYATFLGMDSEKLIASHPELFSGLSNQEFSYGIGTLEKRTSPGSNGGLFPNILWGVALVFVLALAWMFARYLEIV